jgi:hypothetical protein
MGNWKLFLCPWFTCCNAQCPAAAASAFLYTYSTKQKLDLHEKAHSVFQDFITIIILAQMEVSIAEGK